MIRIGLGIALFAGMAGAAAAQDDSRFVLEKSGSGFVRMDRATGEMSICEERSGQMVCKTAADERAAREAEIERLQERVGALEERVEALEAKPDLPTEQEFEQTLGMMERFLRSFWGIVKEFEDEADKPDQPEAAPQRT